MKRYKGQAFAVLAYLGFGLILQVLWHGGYFSLSNPATLIEIALWPLFTLIRLVWGAFAGIAAIIALVFLLGCLGALFTSIMRLLEYRRNRL